MKNYTTVEEFLQSKQVSYTLQSNGYELVIQCLFCGSDRKKCYIQSSTGLFYCFLCGQHGNWKGLVERLGDPSATITIDNAQKDAEMDLPPIDPEIIKENHLRLMENKTLLQEYLYSKRGYFDGTISKFMLGWDGRNITIPIYDANCDCANFKLKRDPTLPSGSKGMFSLLGRGRKRLFNEFILKDPLNFIVISEGEWDTMLLTQYQYPAVTSTGGCLSFDKTWIEAFSKVKKIFLCFDQDRNGAGRKGLIKTARLFQEQKIKTFIIELPHPTSISDKYYEKIDVTDYFVTLGKTKQDFDKLLNEAKEYEDKDDEETDEKDAKSESLALQLVREIKKEKIVFFHDEYKQGYAALKGDGREILKLRSRAFKEYISYFMFKKNGRIISADTITNIIQVLEGGALFEGERYDLQIRISKKDEVIWYDLGNGSIVHIDDNGWTMSDTPPILFRRYPHQLPQVYPETGGNVKDICDFVNLKNEEEKLLFQVYTVASFIPNFPHPIMVLYGPQGAGKTTPLRLLKSLVDPSILKTLSSPDSEREFVQLASHHYFLFLDNISSLPSWLSDSLARAATGDGFSKRELFSDDEDVIYSFQRQIGLNGINLVVEKADLLDRSILLGLERIPKEKRREEQEFWSTFEQVKPKLLGAIFTAISQALRHYDVIKLNSRPRMADFARWGCAITRALGYSEQEFLDAYYKNISQQSEAAIDASPVGTALIAFMEERDSWEGTASELLTYLEEQAKDIKINIKSHSWPKDPSWLVRRIQLIISNLHEEGLAIERDEVSRPKRIHIQKVRENGDIADMTSKSSRNEPEIITTPSEAAKLNGNGSANNKDGLSNKPLSPTTPLTPNSSTPTGGKEKPTNVDILEHNLKVNKQWEEIEKEFGRKS